MAGTFIPENERDHRYGIFHVKYFVKIPYIHTRSVDDIREFGMPSSGFREFDTGQENQMVDRYITINEMLEYFLKGVNIAITDYNKTKQIYDAISEYIAFWLADIRKNFSTNHVPLEDLQDLDKFANVVYDKAKWLFSKDIVDNALMNAVNEISVVNFDNIIVDKPKVIATNYKPDGRKEEQEVDPNQPPPRDSMLEMFTAARERRAMRGVR